MEQKNYSLITIFLAILIISFVSGLLRSYPILIWDIANIQNSQFYFPIFSIINIIINPFLVFTGFYQIGKKFDLRSNLKSLIIRLLTGAYLGHFLSINVVYLIIENNSPWFDFYWVAIIGNVFSLSFLGTFFAAFTALAIAYLKQND